MDINKLMQINQRILNCPNILQVNPECSRYTTAVPLIMEPIESQRILLISRDPSNIANSNKTLIDWENTFFRHHVLEVFFKDYLKYKSDKDKNYFTIYKKLFRRNVYWTHYSKCYPGKNASGNHKQPNNVCQKKYLADEIDAVDPEYMILMGKHIIELLTKENNLIAIKKNDINAYINKGKSIRLICLTHPSNANNKCKRNPEYRYFETVKIIQNISMRFQ
jgi:uracil-DNA glycosylase family 4